MHSNRPIDVSESFVEVGLRVVQLEPLAELQTFVERVQILEYFLFHGIESAKLGQQLQIPHSQVPVFPAVAQDGGYQLQLQLGVRL